MVFGVSNAAEVLLDDFSDAEFNTNEQWRITEDGDVDNFTSIHNNSEQLQLSLTSDSTDKARVSFRLPVLTKLRKSIRAELGIISADINSSIDIRGELLNAKRSPSHAYNFYGVVYVSVFLRNVDGTLSAGLSAEILDSNGNHRTYLIPYEILPDTISAGVLYETSISFDESSRTITLEFDGTQRQYVFDESFDIYPSSSCYAAGPRIDITTRDTVGVKTIIAVVDNVWVSDNYDPAFFECPQQPPIAPLHLLLDE